MQFQMLMYMYKSTILSIPFFIGVLPVGSSGFDFCQAMKETATKESLTVWLNLQDHLGSSAVVKYF